MGFKIIWKSTSRWVGTERTEHESSETFETREEADAALAELEADGSFMEEVHAAAVKGQGVEGWLEIEED